MPSVDRTTTHTTQRKPIAGRSQPSAARASTEARSSTDAAVKVQSPADVSKVDSNAAAKAAAKKLIDVLETHKDLDGDDGLAGYGQGDARITERRSALATLLSEKTGSVVKEKTLARISDEIERDIEFLKSTDRREYSVGGKGQFEWFRPFNNWTVSDSHLEAEFTSRVAAQSKQATAFDAGKRAFFDVSTMSVVGLALLKDPNKRAAGLMDAGLQFRARTDAASQVEDSARTRIDRFGAALLAEQRAMLSTVSLKAGNPKSEREYALLREVIASHPISSTNQIYEARNAVASILTDQGRFEDRMSSEDSPTSWIWLEKAPGATASGYSSIHHNFSRDTPKNIEATINAWFFPKGDPASRGMIFSGLTDIMACARACKIEGLGERYAALSKDAVQAGVKDLPSLSFKDGATAAKTLASYLKRSSPRDLGKNFEKNLEMAGRLYRAVCAEQPGLKTLERQLFRAGTAWPAVADVMVAIRKKDDRSALRELGEARLAMKAAIFGTKSGFERHELINFDATLARLTNEHLGTAVDRLGTLSTDAQRPSASWRCRRPSAPRSRAVWMRS